MLVKAALIRVATPAIPAAAANAMSATTSAYSIRSCPRVFSRRARRASRIDVNGIAALARVGGQLRADIGERRIDLCSDGTHSGRRREGDQRDYQRVLDQILSALLCDESLHIAGQRLNSHVEFQH